MSFGRVPGNAINGTAKYRSRINRPKGPGNDGRHPARQRANRDPSDIGWVVAYTGVWVFVMDWIKRATYRVIDQAAGWQAKHRDIVTQSLKS
jgi:hypothetical protein